MSKKRKNMRQMLIIHDPHCWFCGAHLTYETSTIDHFVPRSKGGPDRPENYRLSCAICNNAKDDLPINQLVCPLPRGFGLIPLSRLEETTMTKIAGFNYATIKDTKVRARVKSQAKEIRGLVEKSAEMMIDIGQRLIEVKTSIGTKAFRQWLTAEFGWNEPRAHDWMKAAEKFGDLDCLPMFDLTALINLTRRNVPDEAVKEAVQVARAGEKVTCKRSQEIISRFNPVPIRSDAGKRRKPTAAENPVDALRASLDAFSASLETMASTLPRDEREALADRFLHLALKLREQPATTQKPPSKSRKRTRPRKGAAA